MIIGNGMLAKRFSDFRSNPDIIIFASGVSNSLETNLSAFQREESLIRETLQRYPDKTIVYFGTCSIFDTSLQDTLYIQHKRKMEALIENNATKFLICRTTNVVGPNGNPNTIINYLVEKIANQEVFDLWTRSVRNILDVDDLHFIVKQMINMMAAEQSLTINVHNPVFYSVPYIVSNIEQHLKLRGIYHTTEKGSAYAIPDSFDFTLNSLIASRNFDDQYFTRLLRKYYPTHVVIPQTADMVG